MLGVQPQLPAVGVLGGGEDHVGGGHASHALRGGGCGQRQGAVAVGEHVGRAQPPVDGGGDAGEGEDAGRRGVAVAAYDGLVAQGGEAAAAHLEVLAGHVEVEGGGGLVDHQVVRVDAQAEVVQQVVVAEGDAEFGVAEEGSDLADRFGGDEGVVVAAVDRGEEAVAARPLGGDFEACVVHALPVGEHDLGDGGAVDQFLGDGRRQVRVAEEAGPQPRVPAGSTGSWPRAGCVAGNALVAIFPPANGRIESAPSAVGDGRDER